MATMTTFEMVEAWLRAREAGDVLGADEIAWNYHIATWRNHVPEATLPDGRKVFALGLYDEGYAVKIDDNKALMIELSIPELRAALCGA